MGFNWAAGNFSDFVSESFVIEEWDIGELVLLQEVGEGWVAWSDGAWEDWDGVDVFGNQIFKLGARHMVWLIKLLLVLVILHNIIFRETVEYEIMTVLTSLIKKKY